MKVNKEETVLEKARRTKETLLRNIAEAEAYFDRTSPEDPFRESLTAAVEANKAGVIACSHVIEMVEKTPVPPMYAEIIEAQTGMATRILKRIMGEARVFCGSRPSTS